jgi:hypothetical protein
MESRLVAGRLDQFAGDLAELDVAPLADGAQHREGPLGATSVLRHGDPNSLVNHSA